MAGKDLVGHCSYYSFSSLLYSGVRKDLEHFYMPFLRNSKLHFINNSYNHVAPPGLTTSRPGGATCL